MLSKVLKDPKILKVTFDVALNWTNVWGARALDSLRESMKGLLCARSPVRSIWLALAHSLVANEESDGEDGWCLNMCTKSDAVASLPSPPAPASPRSPSLRPGPGASRGPGLGRQHQTTHLNLQILTLQTTEWLQKWSLFKNEILTSRLYAR